LTVSHCDPETLALRSLGEVVGTPEENAHLQSCAQCQAELASLRTVVVAASVGGGDVHVTAPPAQVWERITAELSAGSDEASAPVAAPRASEPSLAPVTPLRPKHRARSRPATWLLAAAGFGGILVGGVGTAVVLSSPTAPEATVAASVDLEPLPAWDASGIAELRVAEDGTRVLVVSVDADAPAPTDGYREVWLIDTDVEGMVSLGNLEGSTGEFVVPDGVDVAEFPIVDVSLEPLDGDPTHSGNSIVRGTIDA
jgi:hypothetical protein